MLLPFGCCLPRCAVHISRLIQVVVIVVVGNPEPSAGEPATPDDEPAAQGAEADQD